MSTAEKNKMKFLPKVTFILVFTFLFTSSSLLYANQSTKNTLPVFYLGDKNAPVTIYEFISLSCPFCAENFEHFMPKNGKENAITKLIKNGKVKLIIMDFPIHGKIDLLAHSILYYSKNNEQYFKLVQLFLNNQSKWFKANNPDSVIINYAKLVGINDTSISKYQKDKTTSKNIENKANSYIKKYSIQGTPTTIIEKSNKPITTKSYKIVGLSNIKDLEKAINSLLK